MTLSNTRATIGLNSRATPTKAGSNGAIQIGDNNETIALTAVTKIISFEAVIAGSGSDLIIDVSDLDNTGSTAWTPGSAQTETATAAGTTGGAGNVTVTVTSTGASWSPKAISVAVANNDTATVWAGKVRTALAADADVSALWTVGGAGTAIVLTRKPTKTYTVNGASVPLYAANVAANVALANGSPDPDITPAATSAEVAGVLTVGTYAPDLDGTDFEGVATGGLASLQSFSIKNASDSSGVIGITQGETIVTYSLPASGALTAVASSLSMGDDIKIEPVGSAKVHVTIAGS